MNSVGAGSSPWAVRAIPWEDLTAPIHRYVGVAFVIGRGVHLRGFVRVFSALAVLTICGCGWFPLPGAPGPFPFSLDLSIIFGAPNPDLTDDNANDLFESAQRVQLTGDEMFIIQGEIDGLGDVDIYNLGPVEAGDRVFVDMIPALSLKGAIGLFDEDGNSLLINDHRNVYLGRAEPFIDVVVRRPSGACHVAVAPSPGYDSTGEYVLRAFKESDQDLPASRPDTILLNFAGATDVRIGRRPLVDIPEFNAEPMGTRYLGMEDLIIDEIVAQVRGDFIGFDVVILSTSEGDSAAGAMSRVHFGTFDPALLGVAQSIDEFNAFKAQDAIVFTDTFDAFARLNPSAEVLAQAIANVASHEIGHLLGLVHTRDPRGIMDVTASLNALLLDQRFSRSPIFDDAFPIGMQDAVFYLYDVTGGDIELALSHSGRDFEKEVFAAKATDGPSAYHTLFLSSCAVREFEP